MKKFSLVVVALLLISTLVLSGCSPTDDLKDTLVFAIQTDIENLDPQQAWTTNIAHTAIFGYPITMGMDGMTPTPYLVESFEAAPDGMSMTLVFPADLKFSNGKPVTAEDVLASINRYIEISPYASDWDGVREVTADGQTLTIHFYEPTAYFYPVVASAYTVIVDVAVAAELGDEGFGLDPVGVGPYVLTNWQQGAELNYTRNPYFTTHSPLVTNQGPWKFENLKVRIIPDGLTLVNELESGNVDVVTAVPAEFVNRLNNNKNINMYQFPAAGQTYLRFNTDKAPFNDVRFRQAVNFAINKNDIQTAFNGHVEPVYGLLSPSQIGYSAETEATLKEKLSHDQEKAISLLAELGYTQKNSDGILVKDGQPLVINLLGPATARNAATVIQAQLKEVGIDVRIQEQAGSYIREAVRERNFDMAFAGWSWQDGDIWYYGLHSSMGPSVVWSSPNTDRLLEEQRTLVNMDERVAKFSELSTEVAEHLPFISLYYDYNYTAIRSNVEGYIISDTGGIYWNDAYKR